MAARFGRRWGAVAMFFLVLAAMTGPALAQDAAGSKTAADPAISTSKLETLLKPLTQETLAAEAAAWQAILEGKGEELAAARIAQADEATPENNEKVSALRGEVSAVVDRYKLVLAALAARGGDVATHELYVKAVSESPVGVDDFKNPESALKLGAMAIDWLKSPEGGIKWATKIVLFLLTLLAFKILASILGKITAKAVGALKKTSNLLKDFFVNVVKKVVFLIGLIMALSMLDVNVGPFVAAIGAVGFVVGFALQGTLSNFASGIMILLYRPYDIGDVVNVSGVLGKVDAMSLVSTTVKTPDNQIVVIPNGSIWGGIITNVTGTATRRVDMTFGIGYTDDIQKAQEIMEKILSGHEKVLADPAPVIKVHELADSSVNFIVRPWVKTADYWDVYWDVTRQVKERFDAAGVSIPFPQQDVHLFQENVAE
jgi:small conductance mechanosensitive channel